MFNKHFFIKRLLALSLGAAFCAGSAQAAVIGATPNADFTNGSFTFNLANNAASYTFSDTGNRSSAANFAAVAIQTGGAARFDTLFGAPAAFFTNSGGPRVGPSLLGTFQSYPNTTPIPFSNQDSFYALALSLNDGLHYGYARTADHTLLSYGYQSAAGTSITAGTSPTQAPSGGTGSAASVAEPPAFAIFGLGLVLLGFGAATRLRNLKTAA